MKNILITLVLVLILYKISNYKKFDKKKKYRFVIFPKFYFIFNKSSLKTILNNIKKNKFILKEDNNNFLIYKRGYFLGDFSSKIAPIKIKIDKLENKIYISYSAIALFDTGDLSRELKVLFN